jgi:EAL domain-containing protein (putative c-di-GMP-specific phosphodiesterase class I)
VSPTVFIPLAEQSGQIIELGRWVLERACSDRRDWQLHCAAQIAMSVNVSAHQFMSAGFAATVAAALQRTSTDPTRLTLEVTESVFVRDEERALVVLDELKEIGVKLALDDFGTGYSSLGYLNTLPIDTIKVDQTFIAKLTAMPGSEAIVTAIIGLAHSIGMAVVSEGVETAQQYRRVTELGSDGCQGFYFARPMDTAAVDALFGHLNPDGGGPRLPSVPWPERLRV